MNNNLRYWKNNYNSVNLLRSRQIFTESNIYHQKYSQFTDSLIRRLGLEYELEGHQGCVNCLQWSSDGRYLASGSDDTNVIYWDPFFHKKLEVIPTPHIGNIFSVKFLGNNNSIIATAAGDCKVIVQNVEQAVQKHPPLLQCSCHMGRVKRLVTSPEQPMMFWSAGEDGLVLQYDMREPHECRTQSKIFVDLNFLTEIKCIAINPTNSNYIAVGANDCFIRLYDRRKVKVFNVTLNHSFETHHRSIASQQDSNCVQYYSPGHLAKEHFNVISFKLAATYIAFNSAGTEMLANMGSEQIYLFDVNNSSHINEIIIPHHVKSSQSNAYKNCDHMDHVNNSLETINVCDSYGVSKECCLCDYMKRAVKLMERQWMGDIYAAARDYLYVIKHSTGNVEAYLGLIKCLILLKWPKEATDWLAYFLKQHPHLKGSPPVKDLLNAINCLESNHPFQKDNDLKTVDDDERLLRQNCLDYKKRFLGHCNTTTDIKEVNFLGDAGNYICAGSDEGIIFIWDKNTTEVVTALYGDVSIVNCVQPHPTACFIATSGIDPHVKLWAPLSEDGKENTKIVQNLSTVIEENQEKMCMDPFETMLTNMGYRFSNNIPSPLQMAQCGPS